MSDEKKLGNTDETQLGLPEVTSSPATTQVMSEPVAEVDSTNRDIQPVSPLTAPPRTRTNQTIEMPGRRKTGAIPALQDPAAKRGSKAISTEGVVPQAPAAPRKSKAISELETMLPSAAPKPLLEQETDPRLGPVPDVAPPRPRASKMVQVSNISDPQVALPTADLLPTAAERVPKPPVEPKVSIGKVVGIALGVCVLFMLAWVFLSAGNKPLPTRVSTARDEKEVEELAPLARTQQPKAAQTPVPVAVKKKPPGLPIDVKANVIDPYAVHLEDIPLDPAHRYRLKLERDDSRLGVSMARLDEKNGWGSLRKMASHAALQFGGVKALRMHCEPGATFTSEATFPLELTDLATKKTIPVALKPSQHCWDFEVGRMLELGEGVKKRVRVPTDANVKLGEGVPLKIAYVVESLGENKTWKTGVLNPGESLLAEGRLVRFALFDPYANDNEGTLELELLAGDTESSGIVTPSTASGAQFVPVK
ncbi:MAG: hypothetical protein ACO1OB_10835 [Archangium sp.]